MTLFQTWLWSSLLVCILCIQTSLALAVTPLSFTPPKGEVLRYRLNQAHFPFNNYDVAVANLNEKGLEEYILRSKECPQNKCRFIILKTNENDILSVIGEINTRAIIIDDGYKNGFHSLRAFSNPLNDYEYDLYIWDQAHSQYILQEKKE